ncbi:MAG: TM1802 family CRISPR-associated protein [Candidatus Helarchaeota archaeon]
MLSELVKLGRAFLARYSNLNPSETIRFHDVLPYIVKDPYPNLDTLRTGKSEKIKKPRLFLIDIIEKDGEYSYEEIIMLEYSDEHKVEIVLMDSSGGQYLTPTFKIIPKGKKTDDVETKISQGVEHAINTLIKYFNANYKDEGSEGNRILECLNNNKDRIIQDLIKKQMSIFENTKPSSSFNSILSIRVNNNMVNQLDFIIDKTCDKFLTTICKFEQKPSQEQRSCSLCHNPANEISGNVSPFSFYTTDKLGYIPGGFKRSAAVNNFPVCKECALLLEVGKRVLRQKFSFKIGNENCFIVPKNLKGIKGLKKFLHSFEEGVKKLSSKESIREFRNKETLVLRLLGRYDDYIRFDFVFYEETGPSNSQFNVLLYIKDISPSRVKEIADAIDKVKEFDPNHPFPGLDTRKYPMVFSFSDLRNLFLREDPSKFDRAAFLKVLYCIFVGNPIKYRSLMERFFKKLDYQLYENKKTKLKTAGTRLGYEVKKFLPIIKLFIVLNILSI